MALFLDLFVGAIMMLDIYAADIINILASCYQSNITFRSISISRHLDRGN